MAIKITDECINCGACEPECPNNAIYEGAMEWRFNEGTDLKGKILTPGGKEYDADEDLQLVDLYSCISHYQWGCWGVIMQQHNTHTAFDYGSYSDNRFHMFKAAYEKFFR